MPNINLVDDPMCPYCQTFLEYNYTCDQEVDHDKATFTERFLCPVCQRKFQATSVFEFQGYSDVEELS